MTAERFRLATDQDLAQVSPAKFALLNTLHGVWLTNSQLQQATGAKHAIRRVAELQKQGFNIGKRTENGVAEYSYNGLVADVS